MKIKETKQVPASTRELIVATVCDLCGERVGGDDGWGEGLYDVEEVEISYETGSNYPDGRDTHKISYDICPDCFQNKLQPWLKSQGAEPREEDIGW